MLELIAKTISNKSHRVNQQIRVPQVRVIDDTGAQLGVLDTSQALELALSKHLDLVEVSPLAQPPVCKILNYGAHQYKKDREARKQKSKQRASELKGIRISFKIGAHDLEMRVNQARKFLDRGDRVKLEIILRGRENQYKDRAENMLKSFIESIGPDAYQDGKISKAGNRLSLIIGIKK